MIVSYTRVTMVVFGMIFTPTHWANDSESLSAESILQILKYSDLASRIKDMTGKQDKL